MIIWAISVWMVFYLLNYADITRTPTRWLKGLLGPKLGYPLSCSVCFGFWVTLLGCIVYFDIWLWWCLVVPVMTLFIDLAYHKLLWRPGAPPVMEEAK